MIMTDLREMLSANMGMNEPETLRTDFETHNHWLQRIAGGSR